MNTFQQLVSLTMSHTNLHWMDLQIILIGLGVSQLWNDVETMSSHLPINFVHTLSLPPADMSRTLGPV